MVSPQARMANLPQMQKPLLGQGTKTMTTETPWGELRSNVYLRDKGMCWVCNTFVNLEEYDLGHLVDRCNGGHDDYDNLAAMHKSCNLSKPYHETLEECLKWKLTSFMPAIKEARGMSTYSRPDRIRRTLPREYHPNPETLKRQQEQYQELLTNLKPSTLVWVQGRPRGGAMWKILPPPYRQEDIFSMRITPPGATDNGCNGIKDTLQILDGELKQDIYINIGYQILHIFNENGKPQVSHCNGGKSNTGISHLTVGWGKGQIPIGDWLVAKREGITFKDFIQHKSTIEYSI